MVTLAGAIIAYLRAFFVPLPSSCPATNSCWKPLLFASSSPSSSGSRPHPKLDPHDRWFWIVLRRLWDRWSEALIIVQPETVVSWHRAGFRLFCRLGLTDVDRRPVMEQIGRLIRRMKAEGGKSHSGRAPHPRRTAPARLRDLRAHRFPLSGETRWSLGRRESEALAGLPQQPPRC